MNERMKFDKFQLELVSIGGAGESSMWKDGSGKSVCCVGGWTEVLETGGG